MVSMVPSCAGMILPPVADDDRGDQFVARVSVRFPEANGEIAFAVAPYAPTAR